MPRSSSTRAMLFIRCMNDFQYRPRWISDIIRRRHEDFPVVVVTGMRQAGKSTLLRREPPFSEYDLLDLDDLELRGRLRVDAGLAWDGRSRVVLDEVHKVPELLEALKAHVDACAGAFRAVLSGSAVLLLHRGVAESLAGRASYVTLGPCTLGEWESHPPPSVLEDLLAGRAPTGRGRATDAAAVIARGLLPAVLGHNDPSAWWEAYTATYLERDLRDLSAVQSLPDFRRLLGLVALRTSQTLNETAMAGELGLSQPTVHRHVNLMEVSGVVQRLPAFFRNRGKRIAKRPKLHVTDPGMAAFLAGLYTPEAVRRASEAGALFESLVRQHVAVLASLMSPTARLFHWRTSDGKEVDLIIEHGRSVVAMECKLSHRVTHHDARHLRLFKELHPECVAAAVVYTGEEVVALGRGVWAVPWTLLAGLQG